MFMTKFLSKTLAVACAMAPAAFHAAEPTDTSASAAPSARVTDLFTNSVVATADGVTVTRGQLDEAMIKLKTTAASRGQVLPRDAEKQVLHSILQLKILNNRATPEDKARGKEQAEKNYAEAIARAGSEDMFVRQLQAFGLSTNEFLERMIEEQTAEAVLRRSLTAEVTDEELQKYYDEHPGDFEIPEQVRAAHVLISTANVPEEEKPAKRKLAEEVLKKARAGEDFAALAKQYSDDPGSKEKGGEYTFPRGPMDKDFTDAAFSLNTNQVSDIVETRFGYHIIKLYEKIPAKKMELAEVKDRLKEFLLRQELRAQVPAFMQQIESEANVKILDERLRDSDENASTTPAPTGAN